MLLRLRLCLLIILITLPALVSSQSYRFAFNTERMMFPSGDYQDYGFSTEIFFHENWALNYTYTMGKNNYDEVYFQFPGAFLAFMTFFSDDYFYYSQDFNDLFMLSIIIPEGISYHAYPREWLEVSPFFSPFTSDYNFSHEDTFSAALDFGFRLYFKPDESLFFSTGFHLQKSYTDASPGQVVNFSLGFNW